MPTVLQWITDTADPTTTTTISSDGSTATLDLLTQIYYRNWTKAAALLKKRKYRERARRVAANGVTVLHCACWLGHSPAWIVRALIEACPAALGRRENGWGFTPLHMACFSDRGSAEVVGELVRAHPEALSVRDEQRLLPLHRACLVVSDNLHELVRTMVAADTAQVRVGIGDKDRDTPFHLLMARIYCELQKRHFCALKTEPNFECHNPFHDDYPMLESCIDAAFLVLRAEEFPSEKGEMDRDWRANVFARCLGRARCPNVRLFLWTALWHYPELAAYAINCGSSGRPDRASSNKVQEVGMLESDASVHFGKDNFPSRLPSPDVYDRPKEDWGDDDHDDNPYEDILRSSDAFSMEDLNKLGASPHQHQEDDFEARYTEDNQREHRMEISETANRDADINALTLLHVALLRNKSVFGDPHWCVNCQRVSLDPHFISRDTGESCDVTCAHRFGMAGTEYEGTTWHRKNWKRFLNDITVTVPYGNIVGRLATLYPQAASLPFPPAGVGDGGSDLHRDARHQAGRLPLHAAAAGGHTWDGGVAAAYRSYPPAVSVPDPLTALYPFMLAAMAKPGAPGRVDLGRKRCFSELETVYLLLRRDPQLVAANLPEEGGDGG